MNIKPKKLNILFFAIFIAFGFLALASQAQAATQIYRSVGPSATGVLENDNSHSRTVTVSSGTATFSSALVDNIGVGDAVLIDTGGTDQSIDASDTLLFISGRTSSTVYTLKTHTGATPSDISSNDTYQIYRAYTSLANAESGTKNTSIPITFNGGDRDLVTNDEQWNIACYANGTTADTGVVSVDGWTTDATRYLRIYTPVISSEVGTSQRHNGKWDDEKYKLEPTASDYHFYIAEEYVRVDGLQGALSSSSQDARVFFGVNPSGTGDLTFSNLIIRGNITGSPAYCNAMYFMGANAVQKVFNNIIYDIKGAGSNGAIYSTAGTTYAYNNTVYGTDRGFVQTGGTFVVKNNIINGTSGDAFINSFTSTSNNISDDATSPDSAYRNITVSFLNATNKDFHLSQSDTAAKNSGTDLTSDANLPFSTDIDGATRTSVTAWDIGADETAIQIFRSVGASATDSLATDNSHSRTIVVSSGVATFSAELDNKIGVGDAVLVDTNSDNSITSADTVLFIQGRTSSTVYTLKTHTGATPSDISSNDTYQIYRAYTSAFQATDGGTRNSSIPVSFNSMISRDLMANNEQWNISCYAGQSYSSDLPVDTSWMNIGNISKTGVYNFIKVYTPFSSNEVGFSQRHTGKWTESAYKQGITATYSWSIYVDVENVIIEGLQIKVPTQNGDYLMGIALNKRNNYAIDNIIIDGNPSGGTSHWGIYLAYTAHGNIYAKNNIILNFTGTSSSGIRADYALDNKYYIYNNTIFNAYNGVMADPNVANVFAKNNIVQNSSNYSYYGIVETAAGGNNITNNSIDPVAFGIAADSGTTSSTTATKLVDSTQNFLTTVKVGNIIKNTTDNTFTYVTAIDSNTQLSVNNDIFTTGESYTISTNKYGSVSFVSTVSGAEDFHLSQSDTIAREAGVNLTTEAPPGAGFLFGTDIDGQLRNPSGTGWDIGADEGMVEFTPTVMQSGGDYSSLGSWESGVQTDLVASTTRVFAHGGKTGTIADNATVTGQTSGATATVVHATTTQILLESISGTFQSGETVQVTAGNSVVISDNGNPASAVAKIDGAWSSADNNIVLDGWITGYQNYIKIYTTLSARHSGKWDETKYRIVSSWGGIFSYEDNTIVNGIQSYLDGTGGYIAGAMLLNDGDKNIYNINLSDNIFKSNSLGNDRDGISIKCYEYMRDINIYNNIIYNIQTGVSLDIATAFNINVYNNTIYNISVRGIYINRDGGLLKNNIVQGSGVNYYKDSGSSATGTSNNISSDGTAPGTNSKTNTTVSFISTTFGVEDFHLSQFDTAARGAGANLTADASLPITTDIDEQLRNPSGVGWDIGADEGTVEFTPSVMQTGGDYSTLSSWEAGIQTDLTATTTRVFSHGGKTGTISDNASVTGQTSGATATVVHATTTQILLENVSGTFVSGETVQVTAGNSVVISDNGNPASAVAKIDGSWSSADTSAVVINGWTTGVDNYVRIYTTTTARHQGKWNETKYRLTGSGPNIDTFEEYVIIDGLQIYNNASGAVYPMMVYASFNNINSAIKISNNILKADWSGLTLVGGPQGVGISNRAYNGLGFIHIYNNIFYDIKNPWDYSVVIWSAGMNYNIYNNTIYNSSIGIMKDVGQIIAKNNLVATTTNPFLGSFATGTDYNATDINDTPGTGSNNKINQTFNFVSTTSGAEDFHLSQSDAGAKNSGADLSADANLSFNTDIDGVTRNVSINAWDIGADETATQIYRSVGPSATSALATDSSHTNTVTLTSGVATFSTALSNIIGVGDAVLIDTGGTNDAIDSSDTLLFIHGRTSSTVYTVRTHTGATPTDIASNNTYQIYRAYTSLSNAEAGTKNTSIPIIFNGGDRDLVTNNEEWNIACYVNGTTADGGVTIEGWTTAQQNFVKIYTPVNSAEVGVSQRHNGKTGNNKYYISTSIATGVEIRISHTVIDGIQIVTAGAWHRGINIVATTGKAYLSNNLIKAVNEVGIVPAWTNGVAVYVWNNIIYDSGAGIFHYDGPDLSYYYNNTIINSGVCIDGNGNQAVYKNNITQGCTNGFNAYNASSDYNISDLASDAPSASYRSGLATDVTFIDETNKDFHLSQSDTAARGAGANLTADASLPITTDIDEQLRNPSGVGWDIGADEGTVEFTPSVMQTGGDYSTLSSWEAGIQTDLTATTTRVFSHGGKTGTISDNASVTGQTSGATATVVHATTTQILLENVSGTFVSGEAVQVTAGNSVVISDNGNPASAVAKIDGSWSSADTASVEINGWNLKSNNYIKIYTTTTARHKGKWDDSKYRLAPAVNVRPFDMNMPYVRVDGLQIKATGNNTTDTSAFYERSSINDNVYSNNILWGNYAEGFRSSGIRCLGGAASGATIYVFNNIIYGFASGMSSHSGTSIVAYNNTLYDNTVGMSHLYSGFIAKNNIAYNNGTDYQEVYTAFDPSSSNNLSSDATAPGSKAQINARVDFVSTTSGSEDFHIKDTSYNAIDKGADLSADTNFVFNTDIDGNTRTGSWDIGADETATQIYRSVGSSATSSLATDSSHANTVTLTSGVATFSVALADNIGVGDAVLIDTGGTDQSIDASDTLLFIQKRISSTSYQLQANNGSVPGNISANDTYQIYRAYTSLANAESGTKNTSISITFNGGDRDLVTNNEEWNIACYANGTTADSGATISGWTTGKYNYFRIYTPVSSSEVGTSQRHIGKWDDNYYHVDSVSHMIFYSYLEHIRFEGLQLFLTPALANQNPRFIRSFANSQLSEIHISDNILKTNLAVLDASHYGLGVIDESGNVGNYFIKNNIFYGFDSLSNTSTAITNNNGSMWIYNNTFYGSDRGIAKSSGTITVAKNNIMQNCKDGFVGTFDASSDYNISDLASDAPSASYRSGLATDVTFIDEAGGNFCLSSDDLYAKRAGANLFSDSYLSFTNDIRGQSRPKSPDAWSIGACEALDVQKVKLEGAQIKMEGDIKME